MSIRKLSKITLVTLLAATIAQGAAAKEHPINSKRFYWRADGGGNVKVQIQNKYGSSNHPGYFTNKFKAGILNVGVGMYFNEHYRADISYTKHWPVKRVVYNTANATTYDYRASAQTGLLNFYYDIAALGNLTPFVNAGLGYAQTRSHQANFTDAGGSGYITKKIANNFIYAAGFGTSYRLNDFMHIEASYRFTDLGIVKTGSSTVDSSGLSMAYQPDKGRIFNHAVMGGFRYSF